MPPAFPGILHWQEAGTKTTRREWTAVCNGQSEAFKRAASEAHADILEETTPSIEEIFVAHVRRGK
jgi:hypothetical protein